MEELMFADGVFPDFSVLEEVLLPPCFASVQTLSNLGEEWTRLISELQYREQPQGVTEKSGTSKCNSNVRPEARTDKPCHSKSSRGRKRRSSSRVCERKTGKRCQSQGHTNNLHYSEPRMSCKTQVTEQTVLSLLEESVKNIPKFENNEDHTQGGCSTSNDFNRTFFLRHSSKLSHSTSNTTMEILNRINVECNQLTKAEGEEESQHLVQSKVQNGFSQHFEINNNILKLDRHCLSSSSKVQGVETTVHPESVNTTTNSESLFKECHTSTSCKVQNVKNTEDHSQKSTIINGSSDNLGGFQKTPRKQKTPTRSLEKIDPNFQGIEFQMHLCFEEEKCDDFRLIVSSVYSQGRNRRKSTKSRTRIKSTSLSTGSDDDQTQTASTRTKRCASCKTQKTPLWRDAEDGTPLCNACGIRYKKYGMRCGECWNIPKKDGKSCSRYCGCGGVFRALI
ncbi:GATA-type zinc finger protein 1 [Pyxicephalus adspersus]|uniref:GATA-type zinc finger protein 1 n=1 Tax=Pyxicephalus adspersus TaxID=30357 RepID=UPI003B594B3A